MIKTILADDHGIVRSGMRLTLKNTSDIDVIAEAKTGEEAVLLAQKLKPDLILMDMNMPGTDGFSAALQIINMGLPTKVLIISSQENSWLQSRFLKIGVSGYLSKDVAPDTLKKAIRVIYGGEKFFDIHSSTSVDSIDSPFTALSDREFQIMLMVIRGMESQEIANRLFLSKKTVHGYHRELLKKMDIATDIELTRLGIKYGLVDLDGGCI